MTDNEKYLALVTGALNHKGLVLTTKQKQSIIDADKGFFKLEVDTYDYEKPSDFDIIDTSPREVILDLFAKVHLDMCWPIGLDSDETKLKFNKKILKFIKDNEKWLIKKECS